MLQAIGLQPGKLKEGTPEFPDFRKGVHSGTKKDAVETITLIKIFLCSHANRYPCYRTQRNRRMWVSSSVVR